MYCIYFKFIYIVYTRYTIYRIFSVCSLYMFWICNICDVQYSIYVYTQYICIYINSIYMYTYIYIYYVHYDAHRDSVFASAQRHYDYCLFFYRQTSFVPTQTHIRHMHTYNIIYQICNAYITLYITYGLYIVHVLYILCIIGSVHLETNNNINIVCSCTDRHQARENRELTP